MFPSCIPSVFSSADRAVPHRSEDHGTTWRWKSPRYLKVQLQMSRGVPCRVPFPWSHDCRISRHLLGTYCAVRRSTVLCLCCELHSLCGRPVLWFLFVGAEALARKDLDPVGAAPVVCARDRLQIMVFILNGSAASGLRTKFWLSLKLS